MAKASEKEGAGNSSTSSVVMKLKKSTKGTHVYESTDDDVICTQVYLKKGNFPDPEEPPKKIKLVIKFPS